jgi:hypothetical protein
MATPVERAAGLEGQVNELLEMYDCAESTYGYEHTRATGFSNNENEQRRNVADTFNKGPLSGSSLSQGSMFYGMNFVYLMSRFGAKGNMLTCMNAVKQCYFRTAGWFMMGISFNYFVKVNNLAGQWGGNPYMLQLNTRVAQNEQTHNILRSMQFHLSTRQMKMWEANPRSG